jgi:fumarate reductase subunit D
VAERGLSAWAALGILIGVTVLGLLVDSFRGEQLGTAFDIGIIAGSAIAILAVRRSSMFPVVVAPPIVYSLGAGISLYMRSGGLHDRGVLIDAATNWLVYGFPAIAAASAVVLIIAGIRLITRR